MGLRENVTVAQVRQFCEMVSEEEMFHKIMLQIKIKETYNIMKLKASKIDKSKVYRLGEKLHLLFSVTCS